MFSQFRMQEEQNSYDRHGIQVVVGHYIGNSLDPSQNLNITEGIYIVRVIEWLDKVDDN